MASVKRITIYGNIMTLSITTLSVMIFSIKIRILTLSLTILSLKTPYAYADG